MIYFIQADGIGHIKIGFTDGDDASARMSDLQTGSPVQLRLLGTMPGTLDDEKDLHRRFAAARVCGEWFKPVKELLDIVPAKEVLRCGASEVTELQVSIKVLTVGRKQLSTSLFKQIPTGHPVRWLELGDWLLQQSQDPTRWWPEFSNKCRLQDFYSGRIWGWVAPSFLSDSRTDRKWVMFDSLGTLYKCNVTENIDVPKKFIDFFFGTGKPFSEEPKRPDVKNLADSNEYWDVVTNWELAIKKYQEGFLQVSNLCALLTKAFHRRLISHQQLFIGV